MLSIAAFHDAGLRSLASSSAQIFRTLRSREGSSATSGPTLRRHGRLPGTTRFRRSARTRLHAWPRGRAMGQRRLRRHGHRQSRSARPWHDGRARRLNRTHPRSLRRRSELAHLPPDDPVVYSTLQKADTVGMFQIESRAQMSCLPRLRPTSFYDIVVQVAIIRPGPIVGQMVNPFLKRRQGREAVDYLHPSLEPVLAARSGCRCFRSSCCAWQWWLPNFTGGEAEELRRAMGFKRSRSENERNRSRTSLRDGT